MLVRPPYSEPVIFPIIFFGILQIFMEVTIKQVFYQFIIKLYLVFKWFIILELEQLFFLLIIVVVIQVFLILLLFKVERQIFIVNDYFCYFTNFCFREPFLNSDYYYYLQYFKLIILIIFLISLLAIKLIIPLFLFNDHQYQYYYFLVLLKVQFIKLFFEAVSEHYFILFNGVQEEILHFWLLDC